MEIRNLEIDLDKKILKINGKEVKERPTVVTLPGPEERFPYEMLLNTELATGRREECDRLIVIYRKIGRVKGGEI